MGGGFIALHCIACLGGGGGGGGGGVFVSKLFVIMQYIAIYNNSQREKE